MLTIGDRVQVHARTRMQYTEKGFRKVHRWKYEHQAWIVGVTRRQLGNYSPPHYGYELEEPACLHVTGTVLVYRVTNGMFRRPYDVLPGDCTLLERVNG